MKNPDLFQGEKYLNTNKNYFEGWYFKNTNHECGISFIPGINIDGKDRKAFIQVITNSSSHYKGKMEKDIFESISSSITVTLKKENNIIFSDTSTNCGVEIVNVL